MRPRHIALSCAICFYDCFGMLRSLREALRVFLSDHLGSVFPLVGPTEDILANVHQTFWYHGLSVLTVSISEEHVHSASLHFSGLMCRESCIATYSSGPSCSKLTTSLVNDSLRFTSSDTQIC